MDDVREKLEEPAYGRAVTEGKTQEALIINPPTSLGPGVASPLQNMVLRAKVRTVQQVLGGFMIKAGPIMPPSV
jgi:hypothetical protein